MSKRIEFIYLNESVVQAFNDLSQIIVTLLKKQNVVLNEQKTNALVEEVKTEMVNSVDTIIKHAYREGFTDAILFEKFLKEM